MRFRFFRNHDSVKNGILISIRRTGDGFPPGLFNNYIDDKKVVVDQDEYNEVQKNLVRIITEAVTYVEDYIGHVTGTAPMHPRQFARKYQYSTLPYFHDIMNV